MKKKVTLLSTFLILSVLFSFVSLKSVHAQAYNVAVFPATQEITINPGETQTVPVAFFNKTLNNLIGVIRTTDFIVKGDQNDPIFLENEQVSTRFSAASWIDLPYTNATLPPQDKVILYAQVTAPKNAAPGGHYAALYFETTSPNAPSSSNVAVSGLTHRIYALIYIKIPGDIKVNAGVSMFKANRFLEYGPIAIETRIANNGDMHIQPKGTITLRNMFNIPVQEEKIVDKNVFPEAISVFSNLIGSKWMFGKYSLLFTGSYGENNQPLSASTTVWIFPWKMIIVVIFTLSIAGIILKRMYTATLLKEGKLEEEIEKEKKEIEDLKEALKKKNE